MASELPAIRSPSCCRRAWVAHLRAQGASTAEIARALGIQQLEVRRLIAGKDETAELRISADTEASP